MWQLSDDEVETALVEVERTEAALVARRAELVAEADQRGLKDRSKALSTERWLQDRFRLSHRDATTRVEQARLLAGQPAAHSALAAGTAHRGAGDRDRDLPGRRRPAPRGRPGRTRAGRAAAGRAGRRARRRGTSRSPPTRILENLTRSPSTDTLADAEAVARELAAAEAAAQAAETNTLILKYRPDGSLDYRGRIRPVDVPVATAWLKQADKKFAGCDGFEDDRPREQRRGDHLLTTLRQALTTSTHGSRQRQRQRRDRWWAGPSCT